MPPLEFITGLGAGAFIAVVFLILLVGVFASRHRHDGPNFAAILKVQREFNDIAVGILHALQILAGTRSGKPAVKPAAPSKESLAPQPLQAH